MSDEYFLLMILVCFISTFALRALPFIAFNKRTPEFIKYLGRTQPAAVMAMLVIYCLKDADILGGLHAMPEIISCLAVIALHVWKRSALLSIIGGTACYMIIVQNFML